MAGKRKRKPSPAPQPTAPQPMKASAQLDAFPTSDNARRRQSSYQKSVVSIRLTGATIARLDEEAKRAEREDEYRGGGWYQWRKVTRSDVIERAITAWLAGAPKKGGAS